MSHWHTSSDSCMLHKGTMSSCDYPTHVRNSYEILGDRISNNMQRVGEKVKRFHLEYHQDRDNYSCLTGKKILRLREPNVHTVNGAIRLGWRQTHNFNTKPCALPSHKSCSQAH